MTAQTLRERVLRAPPALRRRLVIDFIIAQLKSALVLDETSDSRIDARSRFESLGIDSKRALELKEIFEGEIGSRLRTTLLFDYPTAERLSAYLVENILGQKAPLTERGGPTTEMAGGAASS